MKVYAVFNDEGMATGFYPDAYFPDEVNDDGEVVGRNPAIPIGVIEITEDQWMVMADNPSAWRRIDGKIVPYIPEPRPPSQVSRAQGKIQLRRAGLWPKVLALVDADTTGEIDVWLNDATYWSRQSPYIAQMAAALNLSSATVDQLFIDAAKISAV